MARRGYLRVAGVIENMSDFTCEHGTTYALFGSGGGARLAAELGVPLVGSIPLHPSWRRGATPASRWPSGTASWPACSPTLARTVAEEVAPVVETSGCTARLLDRVADAVAAERHA